MGKKGLFCKYSKDYFDKNTKLLIKSCQKLVNMVANEEFEWDTTHTDSVLWAIRRTINKVDI